MGRSRQLKIAIIAPPWLSLYPGCYYGIENMVHNLATRLTDIGHHVELFTVSGSTSNVAKIHWYHKDEQYQHVHRPYYEALSVSISHLLYSLNVIRQAGDFDLIHDHNSFIGPAAFAYASDLPPVLHTLHEPFTDDRKLGLGIPDNRLMFEQFKSIKNLYFNAVSKSQKSLAPDALVSRIQRVIYNGVSLNDYIYSEEKDDYFSIVASTSPDKGQATAARACRELDLKLKIAGTIGGAICTPKQLEKALRNPQAYEGDRNFDYFTKEVMPHLVPGQIEYIGKITGRKQKEHFARARALIFPINWEEPFGMAVIDALASGTPVVAYNRGAMPEIIRHGVNGFLANNFSELKHYMGRVGEIDPAACRRTVEEKFSAEAMTDAYVELYRSIITRHRRTKLRRRLTLLQDELNLLPAPNKAYRPFGV